MSKKEKTVVRGIGHNTTNATELRAYIERWEKVEEERRAGHFSQKTIMAEAKAAGFDVKTMRKVIRLRKLADDERESELHLMDIYLHSLGMLADTPLGQAAVARATAPKHKREDADEDALFGDAKDGQEAA